ncbi:hypothetical protein DH2020_031416 [Rehmannia glutinosa]|uniref:Uncharacterized protein n=1 Tax=Rehmannia glutinosa TaxID=99300 RepID=A0ABR0VIS6_REHGL
MAAVTSVSFAALTQSADRKFSIPSARNFVVSNSNAFNLRLPCGSRNFRSGSSSSRMVVRCMSTATGNFKVGLWNGNSFLEFVLSMYSLITASEFSFGCSLLADLPTVAETKLNFLKAYKRPIPSIYNTVLQELIVQQHLMRYKKSYQYDPVFALGFVTVYDQLMDGYPSNEDREAIFKAYIEALNEDPAQYRLKLEEWARSQSASSLVDFASREGEVEDILKDISERAGSKGSFSYSRFFAVGLFRLLELANASEPAVLDKLCAALNVNKKSVDRDLDVYRNLLSKLVQAKELLKEYVAR